MGKLRGRENEKESKPDTDCTEARNLKELSIYDALRTQALSAGGGEAN